MIKHPSKIWILTRRAGHNYGSTLQAYALQQILDQLGYTNEIVDYDEMHHSMRWRIRPFLLDLRDALMEHSPACKNRRKLIRQFAAFEKMHLKLTPKTYRTGTQIAKDLEETETCICGSDQIWNPNLFDPVFFLDFCSGKHVKTVAYAPSFGVSSLQAHTDDIKKLLQGIQHLSIRETEGAHILNELTGQSAPVVLDPTLLLTAREWSCFVRENPPEPYICCYFLGNTRLPEAFIANLQQNTHLKTINITTYRNPNSIQGESVWDASPGDFISLIANARYICTDSYHGTAFSILFGKPFFTFERFSNESSESQNSRIHTLLELCGLKNRLEPATLDLKNPDFSAAHAALAEKREESLAYLQHALRK